MQSLSSFDTLADAKAYEYVTYKSIKASDANAFMTSRGIEDAIRANVDNATTVELIPGKPLTVGSVCRMLLTNIESGEPFSTDPEHPQGAGNRGIAALLVVANIFQQDDVDDFFAKGETRTNPYASKTEYDFMMAKNTVPQAAITALTANGDYGRFSINATCVPHSPRVFDADGRLVGRAVNVGSVLGEYVFEIKPAFRGSTYTVDNPFGVVV